METSRELRRDLSELNQVNSLSDFQTFILDPTNRNESMNESIAKILHLVAIITDTPDDKFIENIKNLPEIILNLTSHNTRIIKDETLINEINGKIKLINEIYSAFATLNLDAQNDAANFNPITDCIKPNVDTQKNAENSNLERMELCIIESKLLNYKSSYSQLNSQIMDMLTLKNELNLKLEPRIVEGSNKTIPSDKDYNQFSSSYRLKATESKNILLNLHKRSEEIDLAPSKIKNAEEQIHYLIPKVKRNISYLYYLYKNKCPASTEVWCDFRSKYLFNLYNFFDKSHDFYVDLNSSGLEIDLSSSPVKNLEENHQIERENTQNPTTQTPTNYI